MLTLQKMFKYDGEIKNAIYTTLKLKFNYPVFQFTAADAAGFAVTRETVATQAVILSQELSSHDNPETLPIKDLPGSDV